MNHKPANEEFLENLKILHSNSIFNLFRIYGGSKRIFTSPVFKLSFIISTLILILVFIVNLFFNDRSTYLALMLIIDLSLSILPTLLGVSFAGYAILLTVGDKEFVKVLIDNEVDFPKIKPSTYQKIISVFAWSVFVQAFSLVLFIVIRIIVNIIGLIYLNSDFFIFGIMINLFVSFISLLSFIYSILLVPQNVLNIYQYGQMVNFNILNSKKK